MKVGMEIFPIEIFLSTTELFLASDVLLEARREDAVS
jgi:hypothetical protein